MPGGGVQRAHGGGGFRCTDARGRKGQVRMGIDKARHHHASRGVDLDGVARLRQILHPAAGPHFLSNSILDEQGAILNYIEFSE